MNTRTATTVSKTFIPTALKDSLKAAGSRKNKVNVVIFHDDTRSIRATDTRWGGGTRNEYFYWHFATESFISMSPAEGQEFKVQPGGAVVVMATFCGRDCIPQVYVRNADLPKFFNVTDVPAELPAEVAADWIEERAESLKPRLAKAYRTAAEALRILTHAGAHAA